MDFATSKGAFIRTLQTYMDAHYYRTGRTGWVVGGGWSEAVLGEAPTKEWLDAVDRTVPIVLFRKDVHSCVLNTAALTACHLLRGTADGEAALLTEVDGGRIERGADGLPNGVVRDNAINAIRVYWPPADQPAQQQLAMEAASDYYLRRGFTTVFTMMSTRFLDNAAELRFLRDAEARGALRLRLRYGVPLDTVDALQQEFYAPVAAAAAQRQRTDRWTAPHCFTCRPPQEGGGFLFLGAVKLFSDGALGSRTAAMNRPYGYDVLTDGDLNSDLDDAALAAVLAALPDHAQCGCGLLVTQRAELRLAVGAVRQRGLQIVVHAIGDRAVAMVNKALCEAAADGGGTAAGLLRPRVEHCQHIGVVEKEVSRMAAHGVIASMQPCHLLFDGDYVEALLGHARQQRSYLWRTFLDRGVRVDFGSDWPVAPADLLDGLRAAVLRVPDVMAALAAEQGAGAGAAPAPHTRRYHDVWNARERLDVDTALRAFTYEGAHGAFLEDVVGTVEAGKYADLCVWSADLQDTSAMAPLVPGRDERWWPKAAQPHVVWTIVGGIVEYEHDA
ncbi:amidohydrolase [Strigomonas culicis]|uniref:Amidohydrolase n=1 Tax=Strigomonas culicis TaxID=28005 RepID=S9V7Z1_9TRYP|nr:amidohydrolase [Strigomonas culicis]|eukprot:EPY19075.1 amidohydrolase [Strigomonas culicis]